MSLFNKKSAEDSAPQPAKSGNNQLALLILLLLLAAFGYLYFFTSLIVPHGAPPSSSPASPPQVKQAMPPRGEVPAPPAGGVKSPPEVKPQPAATIPPQPIAQKPAAPVAKPAQPQPAAASPAKVEAKPVPAAKKEEPKPAVAAVKPITKVAQPVPGPAAAVAKEQKPATAAPVVKTAKAEKAQANGTAKKRVAGYVLNLGEFSAGSQVAAVEEKLVSLKIKHISKLQTKKNRQMNRLFYNAYTDYDAMSAEMDKLKKMAKDSFAIEKNGKYHLYTGSFSSAELASQEKKRLSRCGVKVELQKAQIPAQLVQITAGEFTSKAAADKAAASLRKQGLKVKVVPKKK